MALELTDLVDGMKQARYFFLKHLKGVKEEQWDWKPYPECKSLRETLQHLVSDDRAGLEVFRTGAEPNYDALQEEERDVEKLLALLERTHKELCDFVLEKFANAPLDTEIFFFAGPTKLGQALAMAGGEDSYHMGQVAFIRMATDPGWDYYTAVYGGEQ
ncbi:MAG TPA: DinB family protein [Armatimonadota bacterium]|jgi:uncharacterized damage-inducible protein DinB